ncbi:MAG: hypothetical protein HKL90_15925 [Elusimicrobia bacterium]|nr:hypothetical protein [Elusimicrobiota bacterium]
MSLEKVAILDGREVWLAVLAAPEEAALWAGTAQPRGGVLAYLDGWSEAELTRFCAEILKLSPSELAFAGAAAASARAALTRVDPTLPSTARGDEPLDESVWYMFFASYEPDPATRRQPPLIVAFRDNDVRIAQFRLIAARFAAAMNEVLERE